MMFFSKDRSAENKTHVDLQICIFSDYAGIQACYMTQFQLNNDIDQRLVDIYINEI